MLIGRINYSECLIHFHLCHIIHYILPGTCTVYKLINCHGLDLSILNTNLYLISPYVSLKDYVETKLTGGLNEFDRKGGRSFGSKIIKSAGCMLKFQVTRSPQLFSTEMSLEP